MSRTGAIGHYNTKTVRCHDTRPCFAKINSICLILRESYDKDGQCPFCKAEKEDVAVRKSTRQCTKGLLVQ